MDSRTEFKKACGNMCGIPCPGSCTFGMHGVSPALLLAASSLDPISGMFSVVGERRIPWRSARCVGLGKQQVAGPVSIAPEDG